MAASRAVVLTIPTALTTICILFFVYFFVLLLIKKEIQSRRQRRQWCQFCLTAGKWHPQIAFIYLATATLINRKRSGKTV